MEVLRKGKIKSLYISLILILALPEGVLLNLHLQSASAGALVSWVLVIGVLCSDHGASIQFDRFFVKLLLSIVLLIIFSYVIGIFLNNNFDIPRFFSSMLLVIVEFLAVYFLTKRLSEIPDLDLDKFIKNIAIGLLALSYLSQLNWFLKGQTTKEMFVFTEPSHYAVAAAPFFIYYIVSSTRKKAIVFSISIILTSILIENLTLTIPVLIALFILNKNYLIIFSGILLFLLPFVGPAFSAYITVRTSAMLDPENQNLSSLVYLQGWEYVASSIKNFNGFGIGFQQLGQVRLESKSQELLEFMGYPFNQNDGAFFFSKFFVEFGWIGLIFTLAYLIYILPVYRKISKFRIEKNYWKLFLSIAYLSFFIPLFVRNSSYFNPGIFIFYLSIIGLGIVKNSKEV